MVNILLMMMVNDDGWWWLVIILVGGWGIPTPLKNDGVKVSWDDDIPNIWKIQKMFQTTNQLYWCAWSVDEPLFEHNLSLIPPWTLWAKDQYESNAKWKIHGISASQMVVHHWGCGSKHQTWWFKHEKWWNMGIEPPTLVVFPGCSGCRCTELGTPPRGCCCCWWRRWLK